MNENKQFYIGKIFGKDEWYVEERDVNRATFDSELHLHFPKCFGIKNRKEAEIISDRFNELYDEKEELKKENERLIKELYRTRKLPLLKIRGRTILSKNVELRDFE